MIDDEHLEKLFHCMSIFYGNRWNVLLDPTSRVNAEHKKIMLKKIWQSALTGCTYNEIKNALKSCKLHAITPSHYPPTAVEFYHLAKKNYKQRTEVASIDIQNKIDSRPHVDKMLELLKKSPYYAKKNRI